MGQVVVQDRQSIGEAMITDTAGTNTSGGLLYTYQYKPRVHTGCRCLGSQLRWCSGKIHHQGLMSVSQHDGSTIWTVTHASIMYYACRLNLRGVILEANVLEGSVYKNVIVNHHQDTFLKGFPSSVLSSGSIHLNCCHKEMLAIVLVVCQYFGTDK